MIGTIAECLSQHIIALPFAEQKVGGMVEVAVNAQGQTYPQGCGNAAECGVEPERNIFIPSSEKDFVSYWHGGEMRVTGNTGAKQSRLAVSWSLKLACWMNGKRVGIDGHCFASDKIFAIVSGSIFGQIGNYSEVKNIDVTDISMQKGTGVFGEFTFVKEGAKRGLFQYPHEYFGVTVRGTAELQKADCAPQAVLTNGVNCEQQ